jgi:hypothetical protein
VHAEIALGDNTTNELGLLYSWLQRDDEFRGRVRTVTADLKPGDMGGVTEVLMVALGSGGAVATLGGTLNAWIGARRTKGQRRDHERRPDLPRRDRHGQRCRCR